MANTKRRGRGEGSIEELPSGKFRATVSAGRDANGKRVKIQESFESKKQASTWLRAKLQEKDRGVLADCGRTTVGQWLDEWIGTLQARVGVDIQPGTLAFYEAQVRRHLKPTLGPTPLAKLRRQHVEQAMSQLMKRVGPDGEPDPVSADGRYKAMVTLGAALNAAVERGLIPKNPAGRVKKIKREKGEVRPYDADEARRLLAAAAGRRMGAWFHLAVDSGLRPGESLALHWYNIDLAAGTVRVERSLEELNGRLRLKDPKSKKGIRPVRIAPATVQALADHRKRMLAEGRDVEQGPVFVTKRSGGFWKKSTFYRRVYLPVLKKAKLRHLKPHGLRHVSACLLLSNGASVKMVSERLGHESVGITLEHYAHVLPNEQDQAVALMTRLLAEPSNESAIIDSPTVVPENAETPPTVADSASRKSA